MTADQSTKPVFLFLNQAELERELAAEGRKIFKAAGAKEKVRFTQGRQDFLSAAVSLTANHLAKNVAAAFNSLEQRIAELEKRVGAAPASSATDNGESTC